MKHTESKVQCDEMNTSISKSINVVQILNRDSIKQELSVALKQTTPLYHYGKEKIFSIHIRLTSLNNSKYMKTVINFL